jgi:hypothetical protein
LASGSSSAPHTTCSEASDGRCGGSLHLYTNVPRRSSVAEIAVPPRLIDVARN